MISKVIMMVQYKEIIKSFDYETTILYPTVNDGVSIKGRHYNVVSRNFDYDTHTITIGLERAVIK